LSNGRIGHGSSVTRVKVERLSDGTWGEDEMLRPATHSSRGSSEARYLRGITMHFRAMKSRGMEGPIDVCAARLPSQQYFHGASK
jgi:hypothetical protein